MQQNDNQNESGSIDRRKTAFLIAGILVMALAVLIVVYLFTDKTKASSGSGGTVVITPDRIEQISDEVSEEVLDTLSVDVIADMIEKTVAEELTEDKIYKVIAEGDVEFIQIGEDELRTMVSEELSELGITGDGVFTDEQETYIRLAIDKILKKSLANISVTQLLTDEEKKQLEEQLKQELLALLKGQIQNSTYQLTDQDLARIRESLNLEELIRRRVNAVTSQQLEQLQTNIVNRLQKSLKTPVKGVDYFTDAEIQKIENAAVKKAKEAAVKQIESLAAKIGEVKDSVSSLSKQVKKLKILDQEKSADLAKLQDSVQEINVSIQHINSMTQELTSAIAVSGSNLEQVSGRGSEIESAKVSDGNMTIAQFVDVLAGNDQVYTSAIQELDRMVKQLKEENGRQDAAFEKSLNDLESSLDDNGREMDDVREKMEKGDKELKDQLEKGSQELKDQLEKSSQELKEQSDKSHKELKDQSDKGDQELKEQSDKSDKELREQSEKGDKELKDQLEKGSQDLKDQLEGQNREQDEKLEAEQKARQEADDGLQSQVDAANELIGEKEDAGGIEGETIFQKIGAIVKILSSDGLQGLLRALTGIGASTVEEGIDNINTDLTDARARVDKLEKEKWYSGITLLAEGGSSSSSGYTYQESGSTYVYQIPLVTEEDQIRLEDEDTAVVVEFKNPDRLPSNVAFSTSGNYLLITFTNKPTRNIAVTTIHVYKEERQH